MRLRVSIPTSELYSWGSQAEQYRAQRKPGVHYERHYVGGKLDRPGPGTDPVDCLLFYDADRQLAGILNHYPTTTFWEQAGNINIWVDPVKLRRGIATALVQEALLRWRIDAEQQRYTMAGAKLVKGLLEKAEAESG